MMGGKFPRTIIYTPGSDVSSCIGMSATVVVSYLFIRLCSHLISVLILILDAFQAFEQEVELIWASPWTRGKAVYLLSRYLGLLFQLINLAISFMYMNGPVTDRRICKIWNYLQIFGFTVLLHMLEFILALRVYALYGTNRKIKAAVVMIYILEMCFSFPTCFIICARNLLKLDDACIPQEMPFFGLIFCFLIAVQQSLIWYLTYAKHRELRDQITSAILREGTYISSTAIVTIISVAAYLTKEEHMSVVLSPILTSLFSIAVCRLIISIQTLKTDNINIGMELSTISCTTEC